MVEQAKLLAGIKDVLDRGDLRFDPADSDGSVALSLPVGGAAVRNLADFGAALSPDSALAEFLDPSKMGPSERPFRPAPRNDTSHEGLFLTRFEIDATNGDESYLLNLQWQGTTWELIPDLLSIHEPGVTLGMTPVNNGTPEVLRATLYGGFLLADAIDVDLFVTLWREGGENRSPTIYGNLAPGGPYKLKPLLSKFGFDLPGTDDLAIDELSFFADSASDMVSFVISLTDVWKPSWGDGKFELNDVTFSILRSGDVYTGMIGAKATIIGTQVDIAIENAGDGWWFSVDLPFEHEMKLGDALEELGNHFGMGDTLSQAPGFEDLKIESVGIEIGLDNRELHFAMATKDAPESGWCPFSIGRRGLTFDITHTSKPESSTTIAIETDVTIAGQTFDVFANYGGRDEGWTFSGKAVIERVNADDTVDGKEEGLSLESFLNTLASVHNNNLGLDPENFPLDVKDVTITDIEFNANTKQKNFALHLQVEVPAGSEPLTLKIDIQFNRLPEGQEGYEKRFAGHVTLGEMEFDLLFSSSQAGKAFVAAYQNHAGTLTSIHDLVAALGGDNPVPESLGFVIRDAVLVAVKKSGETAGYDYLLAVDIDGGVNLSELPLVSKALPNGSSVKVAFQPLYASKPFTRQEAESFQLLLPPGSATLASQPADGGEQEKNKGGIAAGFNLVTHVRVGDMAYDLGLPLKAEGDNRDDANGNEPSYKLVPKTDAKARSVKWIKVQKALGPVHFERVGLGFELTKMEIEILLDASLGMGGLTLSVMGLGAGYSIKDESLSFHLDGIGLAYEGGPTEIRGTFLKLGDNDFVGEAMIRTAKFGLSALGAYADRDGYQSLFVYAFLDYPLGGPPFFFVEGLAAGFGYNRHVRDVPIGNVAEFPFVKEAVEAGGGNQPENGLLPPASGEDAQEALMTELRTLGSWIEPTDGEHFLAVGLKFNTFRIVDSFAVAIVSFGHRFRLDVLGLSTAVLPPRPPDAPPTETSSKLAVVEMALKARYDPVEGFLGVQAQLTNKSWVLSKKCHLTGGFAFFSWFGGPHAGDFVTTLGGYHPSFKVPDHYPFTRRLELKWQVSDQVQIKGNCYFALTPNAMMAGGYLAATWHCGDLWAAFSADANFLMQWKPFHYEADINIEISAGYGSLSGSIGAGLELRGPEFSGTAHFKFLFVSFHVDFGDAPAKPPPLTWEQFREGFLPSKAAATDIATIVIQTGVIRSLDETANGAKKAKKRWVVNPKEFSLATSSLVPIKTLEWDENANKNLTTLPPLDGLVAEFGVAPMQKPSVAESEHRISICRKAGTGEWKHVEHVFKILPAAKPYPAAMWGTTSADEDLASDAIIPLLGETVIVVKDPVRPGQTTQIPRRNLNYDPTEIPINADPDADCFIEYTNLGSLRDQGQQAEDRAKIKATAEELGVRAGRRALINALGIKTDNEIRPGEGLDKSFILAPRVISGTGAR